MLAMYRIIYFNGKIRIAHAQYRSSSNIITIHNNGGFLVKSGLNITFCFSNLKKTHLVRKLVFKRIACQSPWDALTVDDDMIQLEKLLYPRRSRMMSPPSLQIYLQSRVTLTFKLLTTKLTVSCPCHIDHLCQLTSKSVHLFSKCVDKLGETNERMDERTDNVRT